ncbi:hypothetical protein LINPERHAP1_LOCUS20660, partial [Linum perenne]
SLSYFSSSLSFSSQKHTSEFEDSDSALLDEHELKHDWMISVPKNARLNCENSENHSKTANRSYAAHDIGARTEARRG